LGLHRGAGSGGRGFGEPCEPPAAADSGGSSGQPLTRTREIPVNSMVDFKVSGMGSGYDGHRGSSKWS